MTIEEALLFLVTAFKWYLIGLAVFGMIALVISVVWFRRMAKRRTIVLNRIDGALGMKEFKPSRRIYKGPL